MSFTDGPLSSETPEFHDPDVPLAMTVKEKWQGAVTEGSGFVAIPMSLLRLQTKLRLTPTDMVVLFNLLAHWWDPARAVFPRSTTIATRMGVAKRTVQRSTQKMVKAGLIEREFVELHGGKIRTFQFTPLAARLAKDINLSHQLAGKESWERSSRKSASGDLRVG
jgi:predicted transcriptional regulator